MSQSILPLLCHKIGCRVLQRIVDSHSQSPAAAHLVQTMMDQGMVAFMHQQQAQQHELQMRLMTASRDASIATNAASLTSAMAALSTSTPVNSSDRGDRNARDRQGNQQGRSLVLDSAPLSEVMNNQHGAHTCGMIVDLCPISTSSQLLLLMVQYSAIWSQQQFPLNVLRKSLTKIHQFCRGVICTSPVVDASLTELFVGQLQQSYGKLPGAVSSSASLSNVMSTALASAPSLIQSSPQLASAVSSPDSAQDAVLAAVTDTDRNWLTLYHSVTSKIVNSAESLVNDPYGNYALQHVIALLISDTRTDESSPSGSASASAASTPTGASSPTLNASLPPSAMVPQQHKRSASQSSTGSNSAVPPINPVHNLMRTWAVQLIATLGNTTQRFVSAWSRQKYSSNVVETVLNSVDDSQRSAIIEQLLIDCSSLLSHNSSHYVLQQAFCLCSANQRSRFLHLFRQNFSVMASRFKTRPRWNQLLAPYSDLFPFGLEQPPMQQQPSHQPQHMRHASNGSPTESPLHSSTNSSTASPQPLQLLGSQPQPSHLLLSAIFPEQQQLLYQQPAQITAQQYNPSMQLLTQLGMQPSQMHMQPPQQPLPANMFNQQQHQHHHQIGLPSNSQPFDPSFAANHQPYPANSQQHRGHFASSFLTSALTSNQSNSFDEESPL